MDLTRPSSVVVVVYTRGRDQLQGRGGRSDWEQPEKDGRCVCTCCLPISEKRLASHTSFGLVLGNGNLTVQWTTTVEWYYLYHEENWPSRESVGGLNQVPPIVGHDQSQGLLLYTAGWIGTLQPSSEAHPPGPCLAATGHYIQVV